MYCVFLVIIERSGKMVKSDIKNKIEKNDNTNANDSLIIKNDRIFEVFMIFLCLVIFACNIKELINIFSFAIKY